MAKKELYDYLDTVTPDYDAFLNVTPQKVIIEVVDKNQEIHLFDDGSERVISLDDDPIAYMNFGWSSGIPASDAGIILDFYLDSTKANAKARSFKFAHEDGHTYVIKFRSSLQRKWVEGMIDAEYIPVEQLQFKVIGKVAD